MIPPVVDPAWLAARRDQIVLADVRWYLDGRSGRAAYDAGHLPGAVFVDLDRWLSRPGSPAEGRHPLPDPEVFAAGMSHLGIADDATVVAYDDQGGVIAGRLVWLLRTTGHQAAPLGGGVSGCAGPAASRRTPVRCPPSPSIPSPPSFPPHRGRRTGSPASRTPSTRPPSCWT